MYEIDWLHQLDYEAWRRRCQQLRRELSQERMQPQQLQQSSSQQEVPAPQPEQAPTSKPHPVKASERFGSSEKLHAAARYE